MILYCTNYKISKDSIELITNQSDFNNLAKKGFGFFNEGIIIDAELNWEPYTYADFHGFEIVKRLRTDSDIRYKGPIVICSPMPEKYFAEENGCHVFESNIVNAPCHYFKEIMPDEDHLEKAIEVLKTANSLDDVTLQQSVFNYFSVRDYVGTLLHDLRNEDRGVKSIDNVVSIINNYFERLSKQPLEFSKKQKLLGIKDEIINELSNKESDLLELQNNFRVLIDSKAKQIKILFNKTTLSKDSKTHYRYPWEVIYIEDNEEQRDLLVKWFWSHKNRVICHPACNYDEAVQIINTENKNHKYRIGAVIADYRLLIPGSISKEEDIQGYTALDKIRQIAKRPMAYFVLTSKETTIREIAGLSLQFKPQWFSKQDVLQEGGGFNLFFNEVESKANEMFVGAMFQPKINPWIEKPKESNPKKRFSYSEYYQNHLTDFGNYDVSENIINEEAKIFIENVINDKQNPLNEWRGAIKDNKGDNNKELSKFRKKILTGRRIVLGLVYLYNKEGRKLENYKIFNFLERKIVGKKENEISDDAEFELVENSFGNLMNTLALPEKNLSNLIPNPDELIDYRNIEILKEEINFLHEYYGYELSVNSLIEMIQIDDDTIIFLDGIENLLSEHEIEIERLSELTLNISDIKDLSEDEFITVFSEIKTVIENENSKSLKASFSDLIDNYKKVTTNGKIISLIEKIIFEEDYEEED
jgi:CheY-like chemotaxis protein